MSARDRLLKIVLDKAVSLNERMLALAEETGTGRWREPDVTWVRMALLAEVQREATPSD
jgi:hypothetical protein